MTANTRLPVHDSLYVLDSKDIYRNEEWWKAVVRYTFDKGDDYDEAAVYLWHKDDDWTRKNKYVIKTTEAWETDKVIINQLFSSPSPEAVGDNFPVSDYYEIAAGETIFQSDGWWKAILRISQKGSYETEEVMVYLWQEVDGDWRRKQKYTIKSEERWTEEVMIIETVLDFDATSEPDQQNERQTTTQSEKNKYNQPDEFKQLSREIDKHLSDSPS